MYTIIETNSISDFPDRKNCVISLHIMVDPLLNISKVDLYRCLSDVVECSDRVQVYLYTKPDMPWIKELDALMDSVFKPYHNISLVLLRTERPVKDISNFIDFTTGTLLSEDFSMVATTAGVLILDRLTAIKLINEYPSKPISLSHADTVIYRDPKPYMVLGKAISKLVSRHIKRVKSELKLKILYIEQAERESTDVMVDHYRSRNNKILSSFDKTVDTHIDFCSVFTEFDTVEYLIKNNSKDKSKDTILIVIDSVDRTSSVNPNNNSYYIPIDTYITPKILGRIFDIILTNM